MNKIEKSKKAKKQQKKEEDDIFLFDEPKQSTPTQIETPKKEDYLSPDSPDFIYYNQKPVYSPQYTDSNNSEDEGLEDYHEKGYHPVHIGEILLDRYVLIQKLGWGHFSTAWLAFDKKFKNYVAIKIQKSDKNCIEAAYDEVEILQELEKHNTEPKWVESIKKYWADQPEKIKNGVTTHHSQIVQLLNSFIFRGPNGNHFCMVFEIMGVTLLDLIKRYNYKGIPIPLVRIITKQILIGLDFLHRMCGIIHTDLKPENILVCLTEEELKNIETKGSFNLKSKEHQQKQNNESSKEENENKGKLTGKQLRKKNQKFKKKQIKKLEKQGLSQKEIDIKIEEIMSQRKKDMKEDFDPSTFNLEDFIERPKVASCPKDKLQLNSDESDYYFLDSDFDLYDYQKKLQTYMKERKRLLHDEAYRNEMIQRKELLSKAKSEEEKLEVLKKLKEKSKLRGPPITKDINVKICDLGNACWFTHHFGTLIQTRQYRAPEVIIGKSYNETTDMFSLACIIFELITGDYLFDPSKGEAYSKNYDHLVKFVELLGKMPKSYALSGEYSKKYFEKNGEIKKLRPISYMPLKELLMKKYYIKENEANALTDFLMPMLEYYPEKRASAQKMLEHPWLKMPENYNYLMTDIQIEKMNLIESYAAENDSDENENEEKGAIKDYLEEEDDYADDEDNDKYDSKETLGIDSDEEPDPNAIKIKNFNNSFVLYGQTIDMASLDRKNPQF